MVVEATEAEEGEVLAEEEEGEEADLGRLTLDG